MSVLGVVLHTSAYAAPHGLVDGRVDAVALWTQGGEIDVTACGGALCGKNMIPSCVLVEVGIAGIVCAVGHHLREFQHIVGIARLGAVEVVDILCRVSGSKEMFVHRVSTDADSAVLCYVCPEILCCRPIGCG